MVEGRLPEIQNVLALQTMMRLLGRDAPRELKQKLEVSLSLHYFRVYDFSLNYLNL